LINKDEGEALWAKRRKANKKMTKNANSKVLSGRIKKEKK